MTTSAITPTLTLRRGADGRWVEITLKNIASVNLEASRRHLDLISDIHIMYNGSEDPSVVAVIGKRGGTEEFVPDAPLVDEIVIAVLSAHAHVPELNAMVINELSDPRRVFFARVLEAEGPRGRSRPIMAPTMEELRRKLDFPRTDGRSDDLPPDEYYSLSGGELFERLRGLFGDEFVYDFMAGFVATQETYRTELEELMRELVGAEVTFKFGKDLNLHVEAKAIIRMRPKPQD